MSPTALACFLVEVVVSLMLRIPVLDDGRIKFAEVLHLGQCGHLEARAIDPALQKRGLHLRRREPVQHTALDRHDDLALLHLLARLGIHTRDRKAEVAPLQRQPCPRLLVHAQAFLPQRRAIAPSLGQLFPELLEVGTVARSASTAAGAAAATGQCIHVIAQAQVAQLESFPRPGPFEARSSLERERLVCSGHDATNLVAEATDERPE
mmetsp:Transcript_146/g.473  ORF Transcript_146/g.473 Transcript_146/m.473 type:complete len:208 (+) Transcript_146:499-1122(+)